MGAKNYLEPELFETNDLKLEFQDYQHPEYQQQHGEFISHLSIIDFFLNCGTDESRKIVLNK